MYVYIYIYIYMYYTMLSCNPDFTPPMHALPTCSA